VEVADVVNWANTEGATDIRNWIKKQSAPSVCKAAAPPEDLIPDEVKRNEIDNPKIAKPLTTGLAPVLKLFNCENNDGLLLYKGGRRFAGTLNGGKIAVSANQEFYSWPDTPDKRVLGGLRVILAREIFNQMLPPDNRLRTLKMDYLAALASLEIDNNPDILAGARNDIINNNNLGQTKYYPLGLLGAITEDLRLTELFRAASQEWSKRK
jgi:hypothetical protein